MQTHYRITDTEMMFLATKNIGIPELYKSMSKFSMQGGCIGLMYYIDEYGHVDSPIAKAVFNSLTPKEQLKIYEYLDWHNEGEPEEVPEVIEPPKIRAYQEDDDDESDSPSIAPKKNWNSFLNRKKK